MCYAALASRSAQKTPCKSPSGYRQTRDGTVSVNYPAWRVRQKYLTELRAENLLYLSIVSELCCAARLELRQIRDVPAAAECLAQEHATVHTAAQYRSRSQKGLKLCL